MPIAGINITNVSVKKSGNFIGPYQMNCNASIKDVKEQDMPQIKKKGLTIPTEFSAVYADESGKSVAEITVEGDILFLDEKNEQLLKDWKNEKKVPEELSVQIMNVIMRDVLTRTIQLTDFLRLPLPLPLPSIAVGQPRQERKK